MDKYIKKDGFKQKSCRQSNQQPLTNTSHGFFSSEKQETLHRLVSISTPLLPYAAGGNDCLDASKREKRIN